MKIFPLHYFPPVSWFTAAYGEKKLLLETGQHYRKQAFTNRMHIHGANRILTLSIPVVRRGENMAIGQSLISYEQDWQKNHWKSLESAYRRSPFFEYYEDRIAPFFQERWEYLADFNVEILKTLMAMLQWDTELERVETFLPAEQYEDDFREAFDARGRKFPEWFSPVEYGQVFRTFEPDLSILDLLCNMGPQASEIIKNSKAAIPH